MKDEGFSYCEIPLGNSTTSFLITYFFPFALAPPQSPPRGATWCPDATRIPYGSSYLYLNLHFILTLAASHTFSLPKFNAD